MRWDIAASVEVVQRQREAASGRSHGGAGTGGHRSQMGFVGLEGEVVDLPSLGWRERLQLQIGRWGGRSKMFVAEEGGGGRRSAVVEEEGRRGPSLGWRERL